MRTLKWLEKLILPYHCLLCLDASDQARDLCQHCQEILPNSAHVCSQCACRLFYHALPMKCGRCIQNPPHFDAMIAGFDYEWPINIWLKNFKFYRKGLYGRLLTEIYIEKIKRIVSTKPKEKPEFLLPIPLHWRRRAYRGFNQAYFIAKNLSRKLSIPLLPDNYVVRKKHGIAQAHLNVLNRQSNIKGAFSVHPLPPIEHIAIVDDVLTTGNTVNELAKQLKKQGVKYISIWVLARTQE